MITFAVRTAILLAAVSRAHPPACAGADTNPTCHDLTRHYGVAVLPGSRRPLSFGACRSRNLRAGCIRVRVQAHEPIACIRRAPRLRASASTSHDASPTGCHARPMDALDKLAFSFPTMVRALLRLLPTALTAELDPRSLRRLPTAHVGPGLRQRHADMPWRIACRPAAGRPPWPHVLLTLEFQATVDRHMALRVETYTALLRQDLLREDHFAGPNRTLPRVLPVVVHTGRERWNAPLGVRALTAPGPEALAPLQPEAACVLLDGPALADDDVRRNLAAALIAVQSCAEASQMPQRVAGLLGLLRRTGDAELGKALRDGLRRMLETRFGGELPRRWMEEPMSLEHRMDEWEQDPLLPPGDSTIVVSGIPGVVQCCDAMSALPSGPQVACCRHCLL